MNYGLNQNISNYNLKEDYELHILYALDLYKDNISTRYNYFMPIEVLDFKENSYEIENTDIWELVDTKTFIQSSNEETNLICIDGEDMRIEMSFRNTITDTFVLSDFFGVLRIEDYDTPTIFQTYQKSSLDNALWYDDNRTFIGLNQDDKIELEKIGDTMVLKAILKASNQLSKSAVQRYKLVGRIGLKKGYFVSFGEFDKIEFGNFFNK